MSVTLWCTFEHVQGLLPIGRRIQQEVASISDGWVGIRLTGVEASGWHTSPELVRENRLRWFSYVQADGLDVSLIGDVDADATYDNVDDVASHNGKYTLVVTVPDGDDAGQHMRRILDGIDAVNRSWAIVTDDSHPYPDDHDDSVFSGRIVTTDSVNG